jgi:hypothetical protein
MADDVDLLPYLSDAYAELDVLTDAAAGTAVNDATVTVSLISRSGTVISGATDLPAPYVTGSNGKYRATIPHTAQVKLGATYLCEARAVKGGFETRFVQFVKVARYAV